MSMTAGRPRLRISSARRAARSGSTKAPTCTRQTGSGRSAPRFSSTRVTPSPSGKVARSAAGCSKACRYAQTRLAASPRVIGSCGRSRAEGGSRSSGGVERAATATIPRSGAGRPVVSSKGRAALAMYALSKVWPSARTVQWIASDRVSGSAGRNCAIGGRTPWALAVSICAANGKDGGTSGKSGGSARSSGSPFTATNQATKRARLNVSCGRNVPSGKTSTICRVINSRMRPSAQYPSTSGGTVWANTSPGNRRRRSRMRYRRVPVMSPPRPFSSLGPLFKEFYVWWRTARRIFTSGSEPMYDGNSPSIIREKEGGAVAKKKAAKKKKGK